MKYTCTQEAAWWYGKFLIRTLITILFFEKKSSHINSVLAGDLPGKVAACFIQPSYNIQRIN